MHEAGLFDVRVIPACTCGLVTHESVFGAQDVAGALEGQGAGQVGERSVEWRDFPATGVGGVSCPPLPIDAGAV